VVSRLAWTQCYISLGDTETETVLDVTYRFFVNVLYPLWRFANFRASILSTWDFWFYALRECICAQLL